MKKLPYLVLPFRLYLKFFGYFVIVRANNGQFLFQLCPLRSQIDVDGRQLINSACGFLKSLFKNSLGSHCLKLYCKMYKRKNDEFVLQAYCFQTVANFVQFSLKGSGSSLGSTILIQSNLQLTLNIFVVGIQFLTEKIKML
jgi:hypothetical protein